MSDLFDSVETVGDIAAERLPYKILVSGESGVGKTHLAGTMDPATTLFVILEGVQAVQTLRQINPKAKILPVGNIARWERFKEQAPELPGRGYRSIVFDGFTELQTMYVRDLFNKAVKRAEGKDMQKEEPDLSQADWGVVGRRMETDFCFLRDVSGVVDGKRIGLNVLATIRTLTTRGEEEADTQARARYVLSGKSALNVGAYFSLAAYLYKETYQGEIRRVAMTSGPDRFPCRSLGPITGLLKPDAALWLRALAGEIEQKDVLLEGARLPGEAGRPGASAARGAV